MKYKDIEKIRLETMAYCYLVAKERGVDGLEEEIRYRKATKLPIELNRKACDEIIHKILDKAIGAFLVLACSALHDEFGFGGDRCSRFNERLTLKADCLYEGFLTWDEHVKTTAQELKFLEWIDDENK